MDKEARQVWTELLVLEAQRGNAHAFTQLYQLWASDIRRMAAVQTGCGDSADEVAQETWVAIARGLQRINDPACFPRWAFRILDRRCSDWIRSRQADRRRAKELSEMSLHSTRESELHDPAEIVNLQEAIARLAPEARKLLHLFYFVGLSTTEIGEILGLPSGTVKSRLFTTREHLKLLFERMKNEKPG